jgi:hypothetical protein
MLFMALLARRVGSLVPPPTALQGTPVSGGVSLSWTNANGYLATEVWRDDVLLVEKAGGVASHVDTTAAPGAEHSYKIRHKASVSSFSAFTASILRSQTPPAPVLSAPVVTDDTVSLAWTAVATATRYDVYRSSVSGSGHTFIGSSTGLTFDHLTVQNGVWFYIVRAFNGVFSSVNSNERQVNVLFAPPLTDPSALDAVATFSDQVTLSWTNGDATAFTEVYRGLSPNPPTLLTTRAAGLSSFVDNTVVEGTTYYYRIRHVKGAAVSDFVQDSVSLPVASLGAMDLSADVATNEVRLTYVVNNPPFNHTVAISGYSDTQGFQSSGPVNPLSESPALIVTYGDIVGKFGGGVELTGTIGSVTLRNSSGAVLDSRSGVAVNFWAISET